MMPKLYILCGSEKGKSFDIKEGTTFIGRSPDNDIRIRDGSVSRRHLKLINKDNKYFIEDLKTTNGTFLNDRRIKTGEEFEVSSGMIIIVGNILVSLDNKDRGDDIFIDELEPLSNELSKTGMFILHKDRDKDTNKNLGLVSRVSEVLMQSLNITEILEKIMDYLFELLKRIDRGAIILIDNKTGETRQIIGKTRNHTGNTPLNFSSSVVNIVIKKGKALIMPDLSKADQNGFSDSMHQIRSIMCVPLISNSQIRGVIYVDSIKKAYGFRKDDLLLLNALSGPAAIAIENGLLYSELERLVKERTKSLQQTEEKLRESEIRYKAIFNSMSSGVIVFDAVDNGEDFIIIALNKAARKIEKNKKKMVTGKRLLHAFPGIKDHDLLKVFKRIWKTGQSEHHSVMLLQDNNTEAWREYYAYRLSSGEVVAIYDDTTKKKKAEKERKALQEQLLASQKMEAIGTLAGGMAHNFRNILQAISGNIEYLELISEKESGIRETAKNIYDSIEKGVDLINNLMHFSKKTETLESVDLNLADVIMKTYAITDRVFNKNIQIKLNLDDDLYARGNHSLLSQVFMNLFTNARDAMPNGGTLSVEAKKIDNNIVTIISDTGCGMDKETQEKIFDPFFTLKEVGMGTGLGLSTTHGIIEQHKGSITVSSIPGKGANFTILLPLIEPIFLQDERFEKKLIFGNGEKILILDDDSDVLDSLSSVITSLGYKAIPVDKPAEALKSYNLWEPDVVLMDRNMPEIDGITCTKEIIKADPKARIVIVSGYEESGDNGIDENVKSIIKGYITKPCNMEELSRTISMILKQ